jgi:DNA modification methylase
LTAVDVVRVPKGWTADQVKAFALADNRSAELAEWNPEVLSAQLLELQELGFDVEALGFDVPKPEVDSPEEEDELVAVPVETVSKLGDLWQIGPHRILCGDSLDSSTLDKLIDGAKVGAVLTDPPYGINLDTDYTQLPSNPGTKQTNYRAVANDDKPFDAGMLWSYFENVKEQFWFGANYYRRTIPESDLSGSWLVWDKRLESNDKGFGSGFELIWSRQRHKQDLLRYLHFGMFSVEPGKRVHPTQKPVALLVEIIDRWVAEGAVVVDVFGGSGSTLLAAAKSGRVGYGCELDPHYVDVIVKRLEELTGEKAVLENASR